ncbi:MAG: malto-oligosyltrehalose synthase [Acidobacteriia bacterium]|nr:malto-oligosyltrehalose synthase [Terriglobia bacterium]
MIPPPEGGAPGATYRLQFNQGFRFVDGRDLVPYLSDLGITDLYSSPRYKARRGSSHGYDIANPLRVNSELGTEQDFDELADKLRNYGMGLLLDTVPNHMAASYENPWWTDVLENGQASAYAVYFDIDWHPATTKAAFLQDNRVLLPVLGDLYGNVLARGEFTLKIEDTGMHVRYFDSRLPLDPKSYISILQHCGNGAPEIPAIVRDLELLPGRDESARERVLERRREKERIKERLWQAYQANAEVKRAVDEALLFFTGSIDDLDRILSEQAYRLAYWKIGYEEINYRRFFDINELIGLRIEVPEVFDNRNRQIFELVRSGKVTGLRIDHIDGLWDPACYLQRLENAVGAGRRLYVVVEKILGRDESLPREWPVNGTTGYEFLNAVNGIFVHREGLARLEEIYARRTGNGLPFAELCYRCNKLVMQALFTGDVHALTHHLGELAARHRAARDVRLSELREMLVEVTACLPVYRTYIHGRAISASDRGYIERTLALARERTSPEQISGAAFDFLRSVLLLDPPYYLEDRKGEWLDFVMRWQQFSGPVMAKGLEDTANYRHNSLLSLNEVGGDPLRDRPPVNLEEFHDFNRRRLAEWPDTLNATATHDTKRGEDVRARLNVLSEMPDEWDRRLERWMAWNAELKPLVNGAPAPSAGEEILIYQTLAGAWPNAPAEEPAFRARLQEFLVKALREGKEHSSWMAPQEEYERGVQDFVNRILAPDAQFLPDFREFQPVLARAGARNSLSQVVLKIAAPGVPDFYQGCELWQLSLVDPDNRRPVDYRRRIALLESLRKRESEDRIALVRELTADPLQDEMKLLVTCRALAYRKANREMFARGEYLPLAARGACAAHVCAFARRWEAKWVVAVAPRFTSRLDGWQDTELVLPQEAPSEWEDVLTGLIPGSWRMADLLAEFPVALLAA